MCAGNAGMMWQGAGNPGSAYGLQQAMAAQAAAQQQQQQQQAPGMQVCSGHLLHQHAALSSGTSSCPILVFCLAGGQASLC